MGRVYVRWEGPGPPQDRPDRGVRPGTESRAGLPATLPVMALLVVDGLATPVVTCSSDGWA
ncbi:hypothetical protein [Streptomyces sp. NPDC088180]|uniref:hypothetical protein n=1 Tax=Streptomyces sp. NPDC088180 TaxID=3365837 RepID=UPI0037F43562